MSAKIFDFLIFFAVSWFIIRVIFKLCRMRVTFFREFWNVLELANLLLAVAVLVLYVGRGIVAEQVAKEATKTSGLLRKYFEYCNNQALQLFEI